MWIASRWPMSSSTLFARLLMNQRADGTSSRSSSAQAASAPIASASHSGIEMLVVKEPPGARLYSRQCAQPHAAAVRPPRRVARSRRFGSKMAGSMPITPPLPDTARRERAAGVATKHRILHRLLAALVAATMLVLAWNHWGMDSVLEISADSPYAVKAIDDHDTDGGKSDAQLTRDGSRLVLDCSINPGYEYPYCETSIELRKPPHGIDLSQYDTMRLWVHAEGPEPRQQVRVFIRNFNPA